MGQFADEFRSRGLELGKGGNELLALGDKLYAHRKISSVALKLTTLADVAAYTGDGSQWAGVKVRQKNNVNDMVDFFYSLNPALVFQDIISLSETIEKRDATIETLQSTLKKEKARDVKDAKSAEEEQKNLASLLKGAVTSLVTWTRASGLFFNTDQLLDPMRRAPATTDKFFVTLRGDTIVSAHVTTVDSQNNASVNPDYAWIVLTNVFPKGDQVVLTLHLSWADAIAFLQGRGLPQDILDRLKNNMFNSPAVKARRLLEAQGG